MAPLFLDSAFVIALVLKSDQNYPDAQVTWNRVTGERRRFVTTTFILDEAVTFLSHRRQHALAVQIGELLLRSPTIEMVDVERELIEQGWKYFVRHDDKTYSLTDCISFVVMRQHGIAGALTFDAHFEQAGFQRAL
jgi:predicted nucleic acid-binding protein